MAEESTTLRLLSSVVMVLLAAHAGLIEGCHMFEGHSRSASRTASVCDVIAQPGEFLNQQIILRGTLDNKHGDYFAQPLRLVLRGEGDCQIGVIPWLPLEVPPPAILGTPRPKVQSDFLGQFVELKGYVLFDSDAIFLAVDSAETITKQ